MAAAAGVRLPGNGLVCLAGNARQPRHCRGRHVAVRASSQSLEAPSVTLSLTLRKPLGLVLAERTEPQQVFVEEVVAGGNAAKEGSIRVGDVLTGCSATVLKAGKEGEFERQGHGARPYDNWERIRFDCRGQSFKSVMAAISSNNERWGFFNVDLELSRPTAGASE